MYFNDGIAMVKTKSLLKLSFLFEETRVGLVVITVYEATGLRNVDPMGQQDPYVQLSLGSTYKKRTRSIKNGGSRPYFAEEEVIMWLDNESWVNNLQIDMFDEDMGPNKPIGTIFLHVYSV
jgi:Ca2+-dependent lipid-binding protein